ncbi:hypothetical protein I6J77_11880 [Rhodanobacter sp. FDAARGOS 1247]|uniref:hypothetical protein n=1 Tax=Rhodanobacter sp. FDAARGOS 1247 TaxID=2778082 RepID=UPI001951609B|nr:hypothetical protein [Rhodanobacter sp. FDAARGOS 1247]QRP62830.1 hypothetical protein I6J77_11880 [Rhodanobacter sp. FDAARGOS 1247]
MPKTTIDYKLLITALKAENQRLQKRIASLEVKLISSKSRIVALEKEIKWGGNRELAKILDDISHDEKAAGAKGA